MNRSFKYSGAVPRPASLDLDQVVDAAARLFARRGYRRTQMADVARALGAAAGTLYTYVEGKEALFDLCVQRAFLDAPPPPPARLPVPTPSPEETEAHVRARLRGRTGAAGLREALARERPEPDARAELEGLVRELYANIAADRRGLALIERSAADRPELAEAYFGRGRRRLLDRWSGYLRRRAEAGHLRPVPDPEVAARLVIETCAWFAWHRHGDLDPPALDDARALETILTFVTRALVEDSP
jgi:AcrR family transcriptional regulator